MISMYHTFTGKWLFLRKFKLQILVFIIAVFGSCEIPVSAVSRVENTVIIETPQSANLHVVTILKDVDQPQIEVGIPVWTPGYYETADYVRNISRLRFTDQNGQLLYHQKTRDNLWIIETPGVSEVKIEFDYKANSYDLNKSQITQNYAILTGTNFFFYVNGHTQDLPASVNFKLPNGWRVATGLSRTNDPVSFTAENYDELVDCPALVGEFDLVTLSLRGIPHYLAVAPKGILPEESLKKYAAEGLKVIDVFTQMFGEIPYRQYITINVFGERGIGGIEHSNSYLGLLSKRTATPENILFALGTHSHEFFHAFNVKRIRPAEMFPYQYDRRNYTPLLWVSEGITNYYGIVGLLRTGFRTPEQFLSSQAQTMAIVRASESAKYVSVEESSINTWLPNMFEGEPLFSPNYYPHGQVIGLLLDLSIRHDTNNEKSLDDVMRSLYRDFYKKNKGFTTTDLISVINRLTDRDYKDFFRKYVSGTEALPYEEILAYAGLRLAETKTEIPSLGFRVQNGSNIITTVDNDGAGDAAGIKKDDVFLGVANIPAGRSSWLPDFRAAYAAKIGEDVTIYLLREGKPLTVNLKIKTETLSTWNLQKVENMSASQRNTLDAWLK